MMAAERATVSAQSQVQTPQLPIRLIRIPKRRLKSSREPERDPATGFGPAEQVVQLRGEVVDVYQTSSKRGLRSGVYVLLQTNEGTLEVSLGPNWYLEEQQFSLEPDDWILVEGTRTRKGGTSSLMAHRVTRGEQVLMLRDENGMPLWRSGPTARKEAHPPVPPQA
jgi:hypothetical protein